MRLTTTAKPSQAAGGRALAPGLLLTAAAVLVALSVTAVLPTVSPLMVAVVLGVFVANVPGLRAWMRPGLAFAQRRILRVGIVLLGLQLAVGEIIDLGASGVGVVVITVVVTFLGTLLLGRLMRVGRSLSILVASGFSICGAAAVAAVQGVTDAEEDDVALAVALVTIYGTIAMALLPLLYVPLALSDEKYGAWAGAGVHEVAQVVVAGSAVGSGALAVAVVVKLSRVILLAPLVLGFGLLQRRERAPTRAGRRWCRCSSSASSWRRLCAAPAPFPTPPSTSPRCSSDSRWRPPSSLSVPAAD